MNEHQRGVEAVAAKIRSTFPGETATKVAEELIAAYIEAGGFDSVHAPVETELPAVKVKDERFPTELLTLTFAVQHNPNCPSPWLVRLPGKGPIDMLPYGDPLGLVRHQTGDILGFGKTFGEAARAALQGVK